MKNKRLGWYFNRLKSMNVGEVAWRVQQKMLAGREKKKFAAKRIAVTDGLFYPSDAGVQGMSAAKFADRFDGRWLGFQFGDVPDDFVAGRTPELLGGTDYDANKRNWHGGYSNGLDWPLIPSQEIDIHVSEEVGDVRTNWELNRHFQFPMLAADYFVTGNACALNELEELFSNWNDGNPYLWGVSWTNAMEFAIRSVSWMVTLAFLKRAGVKGDLTTRLAAGAVNMIGYVRRHRSRFSSANNHLVVEMAAVALGGFAFGVKEWWREAMDILSDELPKQTAADGVNREMSLHYHAFVLEAYLLVAHAARSNGVVVPAGWMEWLGGMAEFLACSMVSDTCAMEFGDADDGKILDMGRSHRHYYSYVLQLATMETGTGFAPLERIDPVVGWLYDRDSIEIVSGCMKPYRPASVRTFAEGGYTFLRSADGRVAVGIDHAPLGFGALAAHGHADAMSFQLTDCGEPVFADRGTFRYHCGGLRNELRDELSHSTVFHAGHPQSQALGPFMWGGKVDMRPAVVATKPDGTVEVALSGHTFDGTELMRTFCFSSSGQSLTVTDMLLSLDDAVSLIVAPGKSVEAAGDDIIVGGMWRVCAAGAKMTVEDTGVSVRYGEMLNSHAIRLRPCANAVFPLQVKMSLLRE